MSIIRKKKKVTEGGNGSGNAGSDSQVSTEDLTAIAQEVISVEDSANTEESAAEEESAVAEQVVEESAAVEQPPKKHAAKATHPPKRSKKKKLRVELIKEGDTVTGVKVIDHRSMKEYDIHADILINAAGPWSGKVADMVGLEVPIRPSPGVLLAVRGRLCHRVINRMNPSGDGDIIVPQRGQEGVQRRERQGTGRHVQDRGVVGGDVPQYAAARG